MNRHDSRRTQLEGPVVSKIKKVTFEQLPGGRVKKDILHKYQSDLTVTKAYDEDFFDDSLYREFLKYAKNKKRFKKAVYYLKGLKDPYGQRFSRCLWIYREASDAMLRFTQADHPSFRWNIHYQKSLERVRGLFKTFKLKPLTYSCDDDVRDALPKVTTHSGYLYLETGLKKKGQNIEGILNKVNALINESLVEGNFNRPILISYRSQASGEYDDEGNETNTCKHKHRVVSMYDLLAICVELMFAKPFQKAFGSLREYAGGKDNPSISRILRATQLTKPYWLTIDYSSFDQTISSWLIEDAFMLVNECFTLSERESKIFDVMVQSFIHKDFIVAEGLLHSDKGVPSGSMWTNIIDSIVNLIVIFTYADSAGIDLESIVCGDDNDIQTAKPIDKVALSSYINKNFGLICNPDKCKDGAFCDVEFLSRTWMNGGEWRQPMLVFSRMCFPERFRRYDTVVTPTLVLYAYILTYRRAMSEIMDLSDFFANNSNLDDYLTISRVGSQYIPGALVYLREYAA